MSIPETYSNQQSEQPTNWDKSVRICKVSPKLPSQIEFSLRNFGPGRPTFRDSRPIPVSFPSRSRVFSGSFPGPYVTGLLIAWKNCSRRRAMTAYPAMSMLSPTEGSLA